MGHIRLGNLPRTRKWQEVVGLIEGGAGTAQIANATITAEGEAALTECPPSHQEDSDEKALLLIEEHT